jgi:hypothetical protein
VISRRTMSKAIGVIGFISFRVAPGTSADCGLEMNQLHARIMCSLQSAPDDEYGSKRLHSM